MDEDTALKAAGCERLGGSIPSSSAKNGSLAQWIRAFRYERKGWGFESLRNHNTHASSEMVSWQSPKLLLGVRIPPGVQKYTWQNKFVLIDIRAISKENSEIKEKIKTTKIEIDRVVSELSKKVDSRVDKAIESMKKQK